MFNDLFKGDVLMLLCSESLRFDLLQQLRHARCRRQIDAQGQCIDEKAYHAF